MPKLPPHLTTCKACGGTKTNSKGGACYPCSVMKSLLNETPIQAKTGSASGTKYSKADARSSS